MLQQSAQIAQQVIRYWPPERHAQDRGMSVGRKKTLDLDCCLNRLECILLTRFIPVASIFREKGLLMQGVASASTIKSFDHWNRTAIQRCSTFYLLN